MPVNANGTKHEFHTAAEQTIADEMAAYDELPEELRKAIGTFPLRASAVELRDKLAEGATIEEALARYRYNLRRIPLSFVRDQPKAAER